MPLRVLEYVMMIYKNQLRQCLKERRNLDQFNLQPVLPIVLYTGTRTWEKLGHLGELDDLGAEFLQRIPSLKSPLHSGERGIRILTASHTTHHTVPDYDAG